MINEFVSIRPKAVVDSCRFNYICSHRLVIPATRLICMGFLQQKRD